MAFGLPRSIHLRIPHEDSGYQSGIEAILMDLRLAQRQGGFGPDILFLVNELAIAFEEHFDAVECALSEQDGAQSGAISFQHAAFLADFADLAEDIRQSNGEIPNAFFSLIEYGPYRSAARAA